ncbi:HmuY family protein [Olivibacter ginsenosidimutans]|uniref:HmuY family protein n=1 Tax=Olivibacter ginsenosidimutans TaxID=1176537 RepID=A0ABP9AQY2_9SPHI
MMKTLTFKMKMMLLALIGFAAFATSCSKDDDNGPAPESELEVVQVKDLDGTKKQVVKDKDGNDVEVAASVYYDFSAGKEVDSTSTTWDIKFNSTNLELGNGATAQLVSGVFSELVTAPSDGYSTEAIKTWYNYTNMTEPQHAILPKPGTIIVLKTHDGKYVKVEIISYYKGNPDTTTAAFADLSTRPAARFYTFNYVVQPDGSTNLK